MESYDPKRLTGAHLRAARALLGLSAQQLANLALLGVATIRRAEAHSGLVKMTTANAQRIVDALQAAGVELLGEDDRHVGVQLRPRELRDAVSR